jgi:DNA adenine methylase
MPAYGGGKAKTGKEIYKKIRELEEKYNWYGKKYFEPFCGMLGVGIHFSIEEDRHIIANDINKDLILMWKKLKTGKWYPPTSCTRKKYFELKESKKHTAERGFLGISCAYSGIFFAGFRPKDRNGRNYLSINRKSIMKMVPYLNNFVFHSKDYRKFKPKGMTIYCDPPYKNNNFNSEHFSEFDHEEFWETMRKWSRENLVIISEYSAPKDFKVVWRKKTNSSFSTTTRNRVEKLYMYSKTM